jgi:hypothetical protein
VSARNVDLSTNTRHWEKTGLSVASTELLRRVVVRTALKMKIKVFWFVTLGRTVVSKADAFVRNVGYQQPCHLV